MNLREKCFPTFLDILWDLTPEEQRFICINQWLYHDCFGEHMASDRVVSGATEDTMGLKDEFVNFLATLFEHARDTGGLIESVWITELVQQRLPGLHEYMHQKFPTGPHFYTGNLNYSRIASNLSYLEVSSYHGTLK